jgi:hypothetical protein
VNEKQIENQVLEWLNYQPGIVAIKVNTTGTYDPTRKVFRKIKNKFIHLGTSDIFGIAYSWPFTMEVKTPETIKLFWTTKKQREVNQREFLQMVIKYGGYATCIASLEDAMAFIKTIPRHR